MAIAVLTAIVLQLITPHTGRLVFWWVFPVLELAALAVLIVRDPGRIDQRTRAARRARIVLVGLLTLGTLAALVVLTLDSSTRPTHRVGATALLGRGLALWVTNVVVFSLWFWEFDRGGAAERAAASPIAAELRVPRGRPSRAGGRGLDAALPRLPVPLVHERHLVQPDRHAADPDVGEDDDDGRGDDLAGHRRPGDRAGHQRAARVGRRADPRTGNPSDAGGRGRGRTKNHP